MAPTTENLGTGTLLLVNGRRAEAALLADAEALDGVLRDLADELEANVEPTIGRVQHDDGTSHALVLDEAHLVLHAFPALEAFSFKAFSRHAVPDVELFRRALRSLRTGRYESVLRRRAAGMPREAEALERRLSGERGWARAQVSEPPPPAATS